MPDSPTEPMSYIACCPTCGAIVEAFLDTLTRRETIAGDIADCIRAGFAIEHVTAAYVREHWTACTCAPNQPAAERRQLALLE